MKEKLRELLIALEEAVPPGEHCHHSITLSAKTNRLTLSIKRGTLWFPFFLDEGDLEKGAGLLPELLEILDTL